jgi:hypothetical protein
MLYLNSIMKVITVTPYKCFEKKEYTYDYMAHATACERLSYTILFMPPQGNVINY